MQRVITMLLASGWGLGFLVLGLWTWRHGEVLVQYLSAGRPAVAMWATRAAAVALIGAGEALITFFVVGNLWERRDAITRLFGAGATAAFILGGTAAVALGVAGR